jgi:hypothetical protein
VAAVRQAVRDPALYVFPLLLLAMMPLGVAQLFAAIAALGVALAALQPRAARRSWGVLALAMFVLTLGTGYAVDMAAGHRTVHHEHVIEETTPAWSPIDDEMFDLRDVDEAPRQLNHAEVMRRAAERYPPYLRDSLPLSVHVAYLLDRDGTVVPGTLQILETSDPGFPEVAREALQELRHTPGIARGRPVRVQIPGVRLTIAPHGEPDVLRNGNFAEPSSADP